MKHLWVSLTLRVSTTCPLNLIWSWLGSFTYTCFQVSKSRHKFQWFLKKFIECWILIKEDVKISWNPRGDESWMSQFSLYLWKADSKLHYILIKYQYLRKITEFWKQNKWILPLFLPRNTTVGKLGYSKIRYLAWSRSRTRDQIKSIHRDV